jgi:hypothetical protein
MDWITVSAIMGGLIAGFMAGASKAPTGASVATAVTAIQLAIFGLVGKSEALSTSNPELIGRLSVIFLGCLIASYIFGNVLREKRALGWMGMSSTRDQ